MYKNHVAAVKPLMLGALLILGLTACKTETNAEEAAETVASEENNAAAAPGSMEDFTTRLEKARPGLSVLGVEPTVLDDIVRVDVGGSRAIYAVKGTDYFFLGEMYQVKETELVNISEQEKVGVRKEMLAKISVDNMIVFSPEGEVKERISVFTDVDCGYCQKLHREVPELNAMGIEVRYLAFPRAGIGSPSYKKIASAWCADDPQDALTKVKNRVAIPENVCEGNPVDSQYVMGQTMGVSGTPTILFDNGESLPGYLPAPEIAKRLGI